MVIMNNECDREERSFIFVAATERFRSPTPISSAPEMGVSSSVANVKRRTENVLLAGDKLFAQAFNPHALLGRLTNLQVPCNRMRR